MYRDENMREEGGDSRCGNSRTHGPTETSARISLCSRSWKEALCHPEGGENPSCGIQI